MREVDGNETSGELGSDSVFWPSRPSLPADWLALLLTKGGGTSNPILARRHTQTNTLQSYGFVTFVINK